MPRGGLDWAAQYLVGPRPLAHATCAELPSQPAPAACPSSGLSIMLLRGSMKPITDLAAAERLHYLSTRLLFHCQRLVLASTQTQADTYIPQ